jgi:hypothetical protein
MQGKPWTMSSVGHPPPVARAEALHPTQAQAHWGN